MFPRHKRSLREWHMPLESSTWRVQTESQPTDVIFLPLTRERGGEGYDEAGGGGRVVTPSRGRAYFRGMAHISRVVICPWPDLCMCLLYVYHCSFPISWIHHRYKFILGVWGRYYKFYYRRSKLGVLTELALTRLALHIIRHYLQLSDCMLATLYIIDI